MKTIEKLFERLQNICSIDAENEEHLTFSLVKEVEIQCGKLYIFSYDGFHNSSAIVYDDDTLFHLYDWQGGYPETENEIHLFDWREELNRPVIMVNNMPHILI